MNETANIQSPNERTQTPSVENTRSSGAGWRLITIIASVVIVILIFIIFAYWLIVLRPQVDPQINQNQTQTNEKEESSGQQDTVKTELDTTNWETFKEATLGVEFKYPANWSLDSNPEPSLNLSTENQDYWNLNKYKEIIIKSPDYTSSETGVEGREEIKRGSRILIAPYRNNINFGSLNELVLADPGPRDFEKGIILDGQDARRIDYTLDTAFYLTEIYTVRGGMAFLIVRNYLESERSTYEETFKGVLSTLKFTK